MRMFNRSRNVGFGSVRSMFRRISSISRSYLLGITGTPRFTGRAGILAAQSASAVFAIIIPYFKVLHKHALGVSWAICSAALLASNGCKTVIDCVGFARWAMAATSDSLALPAFE